MLAEDEAERACDRILGIAGVRPVRHVERPGVAHGGDEKLRVLEREFYGAVAAHREPADGAPVARRPSARRSRSRGRRPA